MGDNKINASKRFRNSQRRLPLKQTNSWRGSRLEYSDGTVENYGLYGIYNKNGKSEGTQSLENTEIYISVYDSNIDDFVGKWVERPAFVDRCLNKNSEHYER